MNVIERVKEQQGLVADINTILVKYGITHRVRLKDITITDKIVSDVVIHDSPLSEAIIDHVWPRIQQETVFHYTTSDVAQRIADSGVFRLYCLLKRYTESEVIEFCQVHDLKGYLEQENGVPKYRQMILPNTFYASFTSTLLDEDEERYFWKEFGKGAGARLTIRIASRNPNFRRIVYGGADQKPIPVLRELSETILTKYRRHFILAGISRLCSFYLPATYSKEFERRAVFRVWQGGGVSPSSDGSHEYVEVPFGQMHGTGFQLELIEIQSDDNLSVSPGIRLSRRSD